MQVTFNTYPFAYFKPGGGEIQLNQTKKALEEKGIKIDLFDQWNPDISQSQIVHNFSVMGGTLGFVNTISDLQIPLAVSSILWPNDRKKYFRHEIKLIFEAADIIFPNAQLEAELIHNVYEIPLEKFHVTYNGVNEHFCKEHDTDEDLFRREYNISGKFVLCVGNIEERKNQIMLSKALSKTDLTIILIGNIRDPKYFDEVIKAGNGKIKHIPYLDHYSDLLISAYKGCEVFVLPSLLETPGLAALEAAALGCKVAVTNEGSTSEYFKDYVSYTDPNSEKSILDAINIQMEADRNPDLRSHVINNFSWSQTAEQCIAGYKKVI